MNKTKWLIPVLIFIMFTGAAHSFYDVPEGHKYREAINYIASENIVGGYSDDSFQPARILNRAELLKIVIEAVYDNEFESFSSESCFSDIHANIWYTKYVCFAKNKGIIAGYSDNSFKPTQNINFVEALKITLNTFNYSNLEDSTPWYRLFVDRASQENFIPLDVTNFYEAFDRGQMAEMVTRIMKHEKGDLDEYLGTKANHKVSYETILNGDNIEQQYFSELPVNLNGLCYNKDCESEDPDYLIITRPLFVSAIQDFIEWKENDGYNVGVLTVEYINTMKTEDNPSKNIREMIKDYKKKHSTKYFLLIGDTISTDSNGNVDINEMYRMDYDWNVPSGHYCRIDIFSGEWHPEDNNDYTKCVEITDLYYADFDDEAWEENADGYIMRGIYANYYWHNGTDFVKIEPNFNEDKYKSNLSVDSQDLDFETIVARIPIRNPSEFNNIFNKIKNYKPVSKFDYFADITLVDSAEETYENQCSSDGVSYEDYAKHINNCAESSVGIRNFIETAGYDYYSQSSNLTNSTESDAVKKLLLKTPNIVTPHFHGSHSGISILKQPDISEFENIFPAWMASSCLIGTFSRGENDSLTESLIKGSNGPAFIIAPTNSYFFYKDLLDGKTVGEAFYNVGETVIRYTSVSNNLFGDPSLKILGSEK